MDVTTSPTKEVSPDVGVIEGTVTPEKVPPETSAEAETVTKVATPAPAEAEASGEGVPSPDASPAPSAPRSPAAAEGEAAPLDTSTGAAGTTPRSKPRPKPRPSSESDAADKDAVYTRLYDQAVQLKHTRDSQQPSPWPFHPQVHPGKGKEKEATPSEAKIWERLYEEAQKKKEHLEKAEKDKLEEEKTQSKRSTTPTAGRRPTAQPGMEDTNIFTKLYADAMKNKERDAELKKKHDAELAKFSFKPEISPAPCKEVSEPATNGTNKSIFDRLFKETIECKKEAPPPAAPAQPAAPVKRVAPEVIERLHKTKCGNVKKGAAPPSEVYTFHPNIHPQEKDKDKDKEKDKEKGATPVASSVFERLAKVQRPASPAKREEAPHPFRPTIHPMPGKENAAPAEGDQKPIHVRLFEEAKKKQQEERQKQADAPPEAPAEKRDEAAELTFAPKINTTTVPARYNLPEVHTSTAKDETRLHCTFTPKINETRTEPRYMQARTGSPAKRSESPDPRAFKKVQDLTFAPKINASTAEPRYLQPRDSPMKRPPASPAGPSSPVAKRVGAWSHVTPRIDCHRPRSPAAARPESPALSAEPTPPPRGRSPAGHAAAPPAANRPLGGPSRIPPATAGAGFAATALRSSPLPRRQAPSPPRNSSRPAGKAGDGPALPRPPASPPPPSAAPIATAVATVSGITVQEVGGSGDSNPVVQDSQRSSSSILVAERLPAVADFSAPLPPITPEVLLF